jgi:hypothetical protein
MAMEEQNEKLRQSSMITRIGCIGFVLVVILLVLIGTLATRASLISKRAAALEKLAMIAEQIDKVPGVLDRMVSLGCSKNPDSIINGLKEKITSGDKESLDNLDKNWAMAEAAWNQLSSDCFAQGMGSAFSDLGIEFEGIRNRRSIERGNYKGAAEAYNAALTQFPANLGITGLKPLKTGDGDG